MSQSAQERRRSKRRPILDTFSLFCVVPKKGVHRLQVHDLSDLGIGFDLDIEGENFDEFPVKKTENLELHLYLNQSLYLGLPVQVVRLEDANGIRRVGAEFTDRTGAVYKAYAAFLQMLDLLSETAKISA